MDQKVVAAYDSLVPADQLIIDAMISTLYAKDLEIRKMAVGVKEMMEKEQQNDVGPPKRDRRTD
jgi:hypothetical protein